ncbi:MAG: hypothetical protein ACTHKX_08050 [Pseudolysinimonas sp.]
MLTQSARRRAPFVAAAAAGLLVLAALTGCAGKFGNAPAALPSDAPLTATPLATASAIPTATPTPTPTGAPVPDPPATAPTPPDPAAAKALAVQACETIADGFAATSVATAAPLAAQAAGADVRWQPLAAYLEFIRTHPIDPQTGAGPQQTVDSSTAAAHDCFTLAGVTVSQD